MAEQFKVGDIVECVAMGQPPTGLFRVGGLYTIRTLCARPHSNMGLGLCFKEVRDVKAPGRCRCWDRRYFRLIHRPRAEFMTELLSAPVDAPNKTEDA